MKKHQYNQGDLLQFQRSRDRKPQLFVITDVFTKPRDARTSSHDAMCYKAVWVAKGEKEVYDIGDLDDSRHVTLVARSSNENQV
jgi:hypothetical protein